MALTVEDVVAVLFRDDGEWWYAAKVSRFGLFPSTLVEMQSKADGHSFATVVGDYDGPDESFLDIRAKDVVLVNVADEKTGWWYGAIIIDSGYVPRSALSLVDDDDDDELGSLNLSSAANPRQGTPARVGLLASGKKPPRPKARLAGGSETSRSSSKPAVDDDDAIVSLEEIPTAPSPPARTRATVTGWGEVGVEDTPLNNSTSIMLSDTDTEGEGDQSADASKLDKTMLSPTKWVDEQEHKTFRKVTQEAAASAGPAATGGSIEMTETSSHKRTNRSQNSNSVSSFAAGPPLSATEGAARLDALVSVLLRGTTMLKQHSKSGWHERFFRLNSSRTQLAWAKSRQALVKSKRPKSIDIAAIRSVAIVPPEQSATARHANLQFTISVTTRPPLNIVAPTKGDCLDWVQALQVLAQQRPVKK
jgi:hypothetical protein